MLVYFLIIHAISAANHTINNSHSISDGETIVSPSGMFELGFFSLGNSTNRYLGMWFKNITVRTYIWVANGQVPLTTRSGVLRFTKPAGNLALFNDTNGTVVWSTNTSRSARYPYARLLDTGNLVLDPTGYPQILNKRGEAIVKRVGPWNGARFSGAKGTRNGPTLRMNKNEVKYMEENEDPSVATMLKLLPDGLVQRWTWDYVTGSWAVLNLTKDECDSYNMCGAHASCDNGKPPASYCGCLDKFVPRDPVSWGRTDWSDGCVRRTPLNGCRGGDMFLKYSGIKMPDARNCTVNDQITLLSECEEECLRNCSCTAYTVLDIREAVSGCLFYHGDLIDIRVMAQGGQDLYIRLASTELAQRNLADSKGRKNVILIASFAPLAGIALVCVVLIIFYAQKRKKEDLDRRIEVGGSQVKETELPFFNLSTISKATYHFSNKNKLGEGGFGPVYRGVLEDGQEIAVKLLSKASSQGVEELENEMVLIANLQHRNLVRLIGCCIEGDENMLIYEYMPNGSLDLILFDQTKSMLLDWQQRFHIINGIAKGLLYLHQDSRLRIIHRDLKASNILLDDDMKPKISDFGLARSFGGNDQTEDKTRRVVGTYGYMSPEYAIDGLFSVKSDVFSFGVLVLEIVSGKRNRGFNLDKHNLNLVGHAWTAYKEDNPCKLVDASIENSVDVSEVERSIHVGLLCVQERPDDRPSMSSVVFMLGNDVELPPAKQPGFFTERDVSAVSSVSNAFNSENHVTITMPEGR
ncbi:g-type lectin s-receptor-like serine/threonine-protein kinase at4g27290 [Phtheirospermum japonicum]|uniref:Receptor-like serine/threonine-protein kinase n=1 Tax=Phtheirospermum japonicum TaxID=374723 RepID=A0A830B735_9LAMI|nr:g-type lectin s-receptor-like serine/threonine-protein kinase at4g27290 [Phtheirospermum japonicum]